MSDDSPATAAASKQNGAEIRVALVASRWNEEIVAAQIGAVRRALGEAGILAENFRLLRTPGAFEIPLLAQRLAQTGDFDVVIACGAIIRGATPHFEYVAGNCARGISRVALDTGVPVIFGVLAVESRLQAEERMAESGRMAAQAALEMVNLLRAV